MVPFLNLRCKKRFLDPTNHPIRKLSKYCFICNKNKGHVLRERKKKEKESEIRKCRKGHNDLSRLARKLFSKDKPFASQNSKPFLCSREMPTIEWIVNWYHKALLNLSQMIKIGQPYFVWQYLWMCISKNPWIFRERERLHNKSTILSGMLCWEKIDLRLISSTFYARFFRTKVLFLSKHN